MEKIQTFNSGIVRLAYILQGERLRYKGNPLRYNERTVGLRRFFQADQVGRKISKVIRVPKIKDISENDVAIINNNQYSIVQMQNIDDTKPKCWQLTLEKIKTRLKFDDEC